MTTIGQTLLDIENLQQDIKNQLSRGKIQPSQFIDDLINITKAYQFDLLAHSSLDAAKTELGGTSNLLVLNYYALSDQARIHEEYIRLLNVGGLLMIWSIFEKFVRDTHGKIFGRLEIQHIKNAYKDILHNKGIDDRTIGRMMGEFNVIRFIRNRLHQGGYLNPKTRKFVLYGETYQLEKNKPVKPIRLMTVINVLWQHYVTIIPIR